MALNINDVVIVNTSYVNNTLASQPFNQTLDQTLGVLGFLGETPVTVMDLGSVAYNLGTILYYVRVLPPSNHSLYNAGQGSILYFTSTILRDNSFEPETAFIPDQSSARCFNNSGSTIIKNQIVRNVGFNYTLQVPLIALASAASPTTNMVFGIAEEDIIDGSYGSILIEGSQSGINTSSFSATGDLVYLGDALGSISNIPGTISTIVGKILIVDIQGAMVLGVLPGVGGSSGSTGIQGYTGLAIQGVTGLAGPGGLQGTTGVEGLQGTTGIQGLIGTTGVTGETGVLGVTGLQGASPQGVTGLQGLQGITGFYGQTGVQGVTGLIGETGIQGEGVTGLQGQTGIRGVTGLIGETGIQGEGVTGLQGTQGDTGLSGATGLQGLPVLTTFTGVNPILGSTQIAIYYTLANKVTTVTSVVMRLTTANGVSTTVTAAAGWSPSDNNVFAAQQTIGVTTTNDAWIFSGAAKTVVSPSGSTGSLLLGVTGMAGNTGLFAVDVLGYTI